MSDHGYQIEALTAARFQREDDARREWLDARCRVVRADPDEATSCGAVTCDVCGGPFDQDSAHPARAAAVCRACQRKGWRGGSRCECGGVLHKRDYASCCRSSNRPTQCGECRRKWRAERGIVLRTDDQRRYDREYQARKRRAQAAAGVMEGTC